MISKKWQIPLMIVCVLLGIMLVTQFRTQNNATKALVAESPQDQATIISNLYDANSNLRKEVAQLMAQIQQNQLSISENDLDAMAAELNRMRILTGSSEVSGPGIRLSISAPLRAEDVMDLVNELRNAGAEAVAVNEQRVIVKSSFTNMGQSVLLDGVEIKSPYVFSAIGNPETLLRAVERTGGYLTIIENAYPTAITTLEKRDKLVLPVHSQSDYEWEYAQTIKP